MFATMLALPKWLLAAMVFCVLSGHLQQVECKLSGCHEAAAASAKTPAKGDPAPTGETGHCDCACHFSFATFEVPHTFAARRSARPVRTIERSVRAPEVPCAEIEYPPKSVRA